MAKHDARGYRGWVVEVRSGVKTRERALVWGVAPAWLLWAVTVGSLVALWVAGSERSTALVLGSGLVLTMGPMLMAVSGIAGFLRARRSFFGKQLTLGERGLKIGADLIVPWAQLATAWAPEPDVVQVLTHDGEELRLRLRTTVADNVAAHLRAGRNRGSYELTRGRFLWGVIRDQLILTGLPLAILWKFMFVPTLPTWLLATPFLTPLLWAARRRGARVRIGADGIELRGWRRSRFIPYREIERLGIVRWYGFGHAVRATLRDGTRHTILSGISKARATFLRELLLEGVHMVDEGLDAGGADAARVEAGAGIGIDDGYRLATVSPAQLDSLVRNPAIAAEVRVASAEALRRAPGGADRLRLAASVTLEPEVRDALNTIADREPSARARRARD